MSKKLVVLVMAVVLLVGDSVGGTNTFTIGEAMEVSSDEVNRVDNSEMMAVPRKIMLKNRVGVCLFVGKPCWSDADCPSGCYCKPLPLIDAGYCGFL